MPKNFSLLVVSCLGLGACGGAETSVGVPTGSIVYDPCEQSASTQAQYFARQGQQLQGLSGTSFVIQGARLGCQNIAGLTTSSGDLSGTRSGRILTSSDFQGAVLQVMDNDGAHAEVAVAKVERDTMDASGATSLFTLLAIDPASGATKNVCTPDHDGVAAAIPLRGSWDATGAAQADGSLQFYCTSGVVAKCLRWGYRPWQSKDDTALAQYHQACTRMARADYCGDGQTHTQDATQIDLYDGLGIHTPQSPSVFFEATWTPQGAYCIARTRWISATGLLDDSCRSQFQLAIETSPINDADVCFARRRGSAASAALMSNRTGINLGL